MMLLRHRFWWNSIGILYVLSLAYICGDSRTLMESMKRSQHITEWYLFKTPSGNDARLPISNSFEMIPLPIWRVHSDITYIKFKMVKRHNHPSEASMNVYDLMI